MEWLFSQTPLWVWGILVLLVYLGYCQTKRREVKSKSVAIIPLVMTALSAYSVWAAFDLTMVSVGSWLSGVVLAQLVNGVWQHPRDAAYLKEQDKIRIPGSVLPFGLMMGIFFTKYFINAALATKFLSPANLPFVVACSALLGLFSGMFIARARKILQCVRP